jgi:hypothetical protein
VVRREHAWRRSAFLWFHAESVPMAGRIHDQPARVDGHRRHATRKMAQLCARARFNSWPTTANLARSVAWLTVGVHS